MELNHFFGAIQDHPIHSMSKTVRDNNWLAADEIQNYYIARNRVQESKVKSIKAKLFTLCLHDFFSFMALYHRAKRGQTIVLVFLSLSLAALTPALQSKHSANLTISTQESNLSGNYSSAAEGVIPLHQNCTCRETLSGEHTQHHTWHQYRCTLWRQREFQVGVGVRSLDRGSHLRWGNLEGCPTLTHSIGWWWTGTNSQSSTSRALTWIHWTWTCVQLQQETLYIHICICVKIMLELSVPEQISCWTR